MRHYLSCSILFALAACTDLAAGPPPTAALSGTITGSNNVGPLAGVTVTVTPSGQSAQSAVTTSSGAYTFATLPLGSGQIIVTGYPNNCFTPAAASYTLDANVTNVVNIALDCQPQATTGTVSGGVTSSLGGGIAGALVTITPAMGGALAPVTTASNGQYSVTAVPAGGGSVAVTNVPANCTVPAAAPYAGLVANQSVTVNVTVTCAQQNAPEDFLVFNGTTSYATIPSAPQLSVGANGLTIAVWMRPDALTFPKTQGSAANQQYVHWLGKGQTSGAGGNQEWAFRMYSQTNPAGPRDNRISFYVFNPSGSYGCGSYFQDSITPGQWIHVVGVVDAVAQTTAIYKNGVFRHSDPYVGGTVTITPTPGNAPLGIGSKDQLTYFEGAIGPVRIWNRALSSTEVSALFASNTVPTNGLVAAYAMTEGQGSAIADSVAGNNGTLTNTAWGTGPRRPQSTATGTSGGGC
jgi:Concanavalin A-like lectin/glucanases superfamily/Carboxypeptidase regulatory-like domain